MLFVKRHPVTALVVGSLVFACLALSLLLGYRIKNAGPLETVEAQVQIPVGPAPGPDGDTGMAYAESICLIALDKQLGLESDQILVHQDNRAHSEFFSGYWHVRRVVGRNRGSLADCTVGWRLHKWELLEAHIVKQ